MPQLDYTESQLDYAYSATKTFVYSFLNVEKTLFTIKNSNKMLIDGNTLAKKSIEHKKIYTKIYKR